MEFEFDPVKSASNLSKHGIDFRSDSEPRFALISLYRERIWAAFFTERSTKIRLISVRRARIEEEQIYYESRRTG